MANRKKAEKAAIDFSVETSTPKPAVAKPAKPKRVTPTASPILPGRRKKQIEDTVAPHPRAATDAVKRQEEIKDAMAAARMPGQDEAEARWKAGRVDSTPAGRAKRQIRVDEVTAQIAAENEAQRVKDLETYNTKEVTPQEEAAAKQLRRKGAKKPRG